MGWLRTAAPPVVYHGTSSEPFVVFDRTEDIGFHFTEDPEAADARLNSQRLVAPGDPAYEENARIIPVKLLIENPLRLPDLGTWDPASMVEALLKAGILTEEEAHEAYDGALIDRQFVRDALARNGYDSIVYLNETEYKGGQENRRDSYIVFDPRQIKSVFNPKPDRRRKDMTASSGRG